MSKMARSRSAMASGKGHRRPNGHRDSDIAENTAYGRRWAVQREDAEQRASGLIRQRGGSNVGLVHGGQVIPRIGGPVNAGRTHSFSDPPRYLALMDRLIPDQARKIKEAVGPTLGYFARLVERMDRTDLRHHDPNLYRLVTAARDAMHALGVELHYQSCGHGVGRPATRGQRHQEDKMGGRKRERRKRRVQPGALLCGEIRVGSWPVPNGCQRVSGDSNRITESVSDAHR
jgi:hypothetical protein